MSEKLFKKYYARIAREGIVKSLLLGLTIGLGALALCALLCWFFGFKQGIWLSLGAFALCTAVSVPLLYRFKFRPTTKQIARRVDALGLEERVITMSELEHDDSYIAMRQREDTIQKLGKADHMLLKIAVSTSLIVAVAIAAGIGLGMTTVGSLYYAGAIESGMDMISGAKKEVLYELDYSVSNEEGGKLVYWNENYEELPFEEETISVKKNENGPLLYALHNEGYVFAGWSDGLLSPYRQDSDIVSDISVVALFEKADDSAVPEDMEPIDEVMPSQWKKGDGPSNGPADPNGQGDPNNGDPNGDPNESDGAGSHNTPNDQINDGNTYYGDEYDDARDSAMDRVGSDNGLSDDQKSGVSDYFDSIERGNGGD